VRATQAIQWNAAESMPYDLLSQDELLELLGALGWEQAVGQVTYHSCMPVP
jgi:hypothetical protein